MCKEFLHSFHFAGNLRGSYSILSALRCLSTTQSSSPESFDVLGFNGPSLVGYSMVPGWWFPFSFLYICSLANQLLCCYMCC